MKSHLEVAGLICAVCLFAGVLRWSANDSTIFGEDTAEPDVISEQYVRGEPVYELLPADRPDLICCEEVWMGFCTYVNPGGRRACHEATTSTETGPNPYRYELRVVDGCPVYVSLGNESCRDGEQPVPPP